MQFSSFAEKALPLPLPLPLPFPAMLMGHRGRRNSDQIICLFVFFFLADSLPLFFGKLPLGTAEAQSGTQMKFIYHFGTLDMNDPVNISRHSIH